MEARIVVNGVVLSDDEASTVRVALNAFDEQLDAGLGDDAHGRAMVHSYRAAIGSIQTAMFARPWWLRLLDWIDGAGGER